jgi:hypothetical protein
MTKYLRDQPFQVGGSTEAYRAGWDRIFGKKCVICKGTGRIDSATELPTGVRCSLTPPGVTNWACPFCDGSGKERPPS